MDRLQIRIDAIRRRLRGESVLSICRSLAMSRRWFYYWFDRYSPPDASWSRDRSRASLQMKVGRARQAIDRHRVEIKRALAEALEKSIVGKMDPNRCLDDAAKTANALLRQEGATQK